MIIQAPLFAVLMIAAPGAQSEPAAQRRLAVDAKQPGDSRRIEPLDQANPRRVLEADAALIAIPERMITIGYAPSWTVRRSPRAAPGAIPGGSGVAMHVERERVGMVGTNANACGPDLTDRIDLGAVRANGFRVVQVRVEAVSPPFPGGTRAGGGRDYVNGTVPSGRTRAVMAGWTELRIQPSIVRSRELPGTDVVRCFSGYRLYVTVRGPRNVNPITGQAYTPSRVN